MFPCCIHCPDECQGEHDAPAEVDCADCATAYESYAANLPT